jgi:hypothetical protein
MYEQGAMKIRSFVECVGFYYLVFSEKWGNPLPCPKRVFELKMHPHILQEGVLRILTP